MKVNIENGKIRVCKVHTLVLDNFIGERPNGYEGSHLDGNQNNNHLDNLAWETKEQNAQRRNYKGEGNGNSKLHKEDVMEIRRLSGLGVGQGALSKMFMTPQPTISHIIRRYSWKHV